MKPTKKISKLKRSTAKVKPQERPFAERSGHELWHDWDSLSDYEKTRVREMYVMLDALNGLADK